MANTTRVRRRQPPFRIPKFKKDFGRRGDTLPAIADIWPPTLYNQVPTDGYIDYDQDGYICFSLNDIFVGVDPGTLSVDLDGYDDGYYAIENGAIQSGYVGSITETTDGYDVCIKPFTGFDGYVTIQVDVDVSDLSGNQLITGWSFATIIDPIPLLDELYFTRGHFTGTVDIGGETITSAGAGTNRNGFVAKTFVDGTAQWVATVESETDISCPQQTVDPSTGDMWAVFVVTANTTDAHDDVAVKNSDGTTFTTITTITGPGAGGTCPALVGVMYDTNGDVQWARVLLDMDGTYVAAHNSTLSVDAMQLYDGDLYFQAYAPTYFANRDVITINPNGAEPKIVLPQRGFVTADFKTLRERDACFLPFWWHVPAIDGVLTGIPSAGRFYSQGADPVGNSINGGLGNGDGDSGGQTSTPLGRRATSLNFVTFSNAIHVDWFDPMTSATDIILGDPARQPNRFMVRGPSDGLVRQVACFSVVNPSTACPTGSFDNNAGSLARALPGSEECIFAAMSQANTSFDEVMWQVDATTKTPDTEDAFGGLGAGALRSGLALARINVDTGTKSWSRFIPIQDNGWDNGAKDMVIDEENNAAYLIVGKHKQFGPEWDGSSLNQSHNAAGGGSEPGYGLIRLNLTTGATVWWAFVSLDSADIDLERFSVALTDNHVVVSYRADGITSQAPNGVIIRNSNLDGHRAATFVNHDTNQSHSLNIVRYTKSQGLVVDVNVIGEGDAVSEVLDAKGVIPPPASGYATEPAGAATATLTPGTPIFSIEAAAAVGYEESTINLRSDYYLPDSFTDGILTGGSTLGMETSTTAGPGGGTAHNILANKFYFGLTGAAAAADNWNQASTAQASPGVILVCARVGTIGTRQVILSGTTANWEVAVNATGYVEINAGTLLAATGTALVSGEWFWAVIKVDGVNSTIDCSIAQSASGNAGSNSLDDIKLFNNPAGNARLTGRMNALKIWAGTGEHTNIKTYAAARWTTL
jgi:hypothetical protein